MCEHGKQIMCNVLVCAEDSHNGSERFEDKGIDMCISDIVNALNCHGVYTRSCCCGHGKEDGVIILHDGRNLIVK